MAEIITCRACGEVGEKYPGRAICRDCKMTENEAGRQRRKHLDNVTYGHKYLTMPWR